jgi:hypothetical protein
MQKSKTADGETKDVLIEVEKDKTLLAAAQARIAELERQNKNT